MLDSMSAARGKKYALSTVERPLRQCLSCGARLNAARRRYCSVACRQRLRYQLNLRTGLLKALNTRYATFYFTDDVIILDIMTCQSWYIYSFIHARRSDLTPAEDFAGMANRLGKAWWAEKNRTRRRYLASSFLLDMARRGGSTDAVRPLVLTRPAVAGSALACLQLNSASLNTPELKKLIKSAYRTQAKAHHPDAGGSAAVFRRIHRAYEELLGWAENPVFTTRSGFPDKWFYDGQRNRWVQPTPAW
jgi:hypothetical protein